MTRLFFRADMFAICEAPLPNGRRADMLAIDAKGQLTIVEIKVSRADLLGDGKWGDYLDYCDFFYWAVPAGFALDPFDGECHGPDCAGLIVADRYDAEIVRPAPAVRSPPRGARRRRCVLPAAPRGGWPAIWIRGSPGWTSVSGALSSSRRIACARLSWRA